MKRNLIGPLCGVLFVIVAVIAFAISGEGQDPGTQTADEIVTYYTDNSDANMLSAFLVGGASILLLFFAGWLRETLRAAEGESGWLANVSMAGLVVLAAGLSVGATIHLALADYVEDVDPSVVASINAIDYDFFIPFAVGMAAFLISTGAVIVQSGVLPKWLGWVAIVLGVAAFTPAGFVGFLGGLAVILVVGLIGAARSKSTPAAA